MGLSGKEERAISAGFILNGLTFLSICNIQSELRSLFSYLSLSSYNFCWRFHFVFQFQSVCKTWLIPRQDVKQAPISKAALKSLFKQEVHEILHTALYSTCQGVWCSFCLVVALGGLYLTALSNLQICRREQASILLWEECGPWQRGKLQGILTTHLLATNLAVKCNQLVSPASLCSRGRESKAPAEGHSVHPN